MNNNEMIRKINKSEKDIVKVNEQLDNIEITKASKDDVAKISSGTPLFASNTGEMTDTSKNYVNTTDGYLYTYSNGNWIKTTVKYQSTGIQDKSISMQKFNDEALEKINYSYTTGDSFTWELGTFNSFGDTEPASNRMRLVDFIKMENCIIGLKDYSKYRLNVISYNETKTESTSTQWVHKDVNITNTNYIKIMIKKVDDSAISESEFDTISKQCFIYFNGGYSIESLNNDLKDTIKTIHDNKIGTKYLMLHKWEIGSISGGVEYSSTTRIRSNYIKLNKGDTIKYDSSIYKIGGFIYNLSDKTMIKDIGWQNGTYIADRDCYYRMVASFNDNRVISVSDKYTFVNSLELILPINSRCNVESNIIDINLNQDVLFTNSTKYQISSDSIILNSEVAEINHIEINTATSTNTQIATIELNAKLTDSSSVSTISLYRDTTKAFEVSIDTTYFKPYILKIPCNNNSTFTVKIGSLLATNLAKCEVKDIVIKFENVVKKQNKDDSLIYISHRGDNVFAPENTFPAFMNAKAKGFNAVETDVEITSDGEFVLLHDDTVDRTSNGTGAISSLTLNQVKALDFGSWKDTKYRGTTIPTLQEFLIWCKMTDIKPVLELKNAFTTEQANKFITLLKDTGMWGKADIISFKIEALKSIADIDNSCRFALIGTATYENIEQLKTIGSNVYFSILWGDLGTAVYRCKLNDIPYIYTTDDGNTIRQCYKLGCSAICTNMVILNECCM